MGEVAPKGMVKILFKLTICGLFFRLDSSLEVICPERHCVFGSHKKPFNFHRSNSTPRYKNMKPCMGCLGEYISLIGQPERPSFRRQGINRDKPINASNG